MNAENVIRTTYEHRYDQGDNRCRPYWDTYPHGRISGVKYNEVGYGVAVS
jgi:hypothetical protein